MNEWTQLLEQTHPNFQTIQKAEQNSEELEWISPLVKLQSKIENIPDKMAFKIGEVAEFVGVKQYVLRYWESEFDVLHPKKSKNGQRMYSRRDVETALLIRKLLHEDRFSIEGAKSALKKLKKQIKEKVESQPAAQAAKKALATAVAESTGALQSTNNKVLASAQNLLDSIRQAKATLGFGE